MIVHQPTVVANDGNAIISSRLELKSPPSHIPRELWYSFPERYLPVSSSSDGFAPTALLLAMFAGEDITIRGSISPKLAYNLLEYRNIYHHWLPKLFHMVDVKFDNVETVKLSDQPIAVATAFSGGIDSFYSLWSHLPENQEIADARLTHGIFIQGFDLSLDNDISYRALAQKYSELFHSLGLELIQCSTNAYQFAEFRINWALFFGAPLIGAALLLSPMLRRFYIPSGLSHQDAAPQGSSPLIDHLLSSEYLDVIHHGASINRFDKLEVLSHWSLTYDLLRVCAKRNQPVESMNCSACHKCYRTMAALSIIKALPKYPSFSSQFSLRDFFRWGLQTQETLGPIKSVQKKAWASGHLSLALGIQLTLIIKLLARWFVAIFKKVLPREIQYQIKRTLLDSESKTLKEKP